MKKNSAGSSRLARRPQKRFRPILPVSLTSVMSSEVMKEAAQHEEQVDEKDPHARDHEMLAW